MKLELTDQQLEDLIYCIRGHIIACEEYNMRDEYDINTLPFERLHYDILNIIQKENPDLLKKLNDNN